MHLAPFADRTRANPCSLLAALETEWRNRGWTDAALRAFRMEDPPAPPPASPSPPSAPPGAFSQEDLNRIAAREKDEGKRAAQREIAEMLGCTPEEAKQILDKRREDERAAMDEAGRIKAEAEDARKKADTDKNAAEQAKAEAAQAKRETLIERALIRAGLADDEDGTALAYALRMVEPDVPADADLAKALEVVNKAKEKFPALFAGVATPPPPPGGQPPGGPPRPAGAKTGIEAGRERAVKEREARGTPTDPFAGMTVLGARA